MAVDLVERDVDQPADGLPPPLLDLQGIKVRHQKAGGLFPEELRNDPSGFSPEQEERDVLPGKVLLDLFQSGQHEIVLTKGRAEKIRNEAEYDR